MVYLMVRGIYAKDTSSQLTSQDQYLFLLVSDSRVRIHTDKPNTISLMSLYYHVSVMSTVVEQPERRDAMRRILF